ncbi:MAG: hypothetical protein C4537_03475 [Acholeplasma sp.]|jgi:hypothetical protein|nr:MAG: hypothetical protein C4537_03475 [Acholeplasma sp.]
MRPPYDVLGYQLMDLTYHRLGKGIPEMFKITLGKSSFDQEKQIYVIFPIIEVKFKEAETSLFRYNAAFRINDSTWKDSLPQIQLDALLVSSIYPFLRMSVHQITDDSRGPINLPIIDLRFANFEKGVTIEPMQKNKTTFQN